MRYVTENSAAFTPRISGFYKLFLSDYHGPIVGCPFYIYFNESTSADSSSSDKNVLSVESSGIKDTLINEEAKFLLRNVTDDIVIEISGKFHIQTFKIY